MTICARNHEEIVFDGWNCPICELLTNHQQELDDLRDLHRNHLEQLTDDLAYYTDLIRTYHPEALI